MPTNRLREVASLLVEVFGWEVLYLTEIALSLHEFQYNGLDKEGIVSRYTNLQDVERDIHHLVEKIKQWVIKLSQKQTVLFKLFRKICMKMLDFVKKKSQLYVKGLQMFE